MLRPSKEIERRDGEVVVLLTLVVQRTHRRDAARAGVDGEVRASRQGVENGRAFGIHRNHRRDARANREVFSDGQRHGVVDEEWGTVEGENGYG